MRWRLFLCHVRRPLPQKEKDIGSRLLLWRKEMLLPRTRLARKIGIGNERFASYERGRAPLKFGVFLDLWKFFDLNPEWLALGKRPYSLRYAGFAPLVGPARIDPNMRFSDAFETHIRPVFEGSGNIRLLTVLNGADEQIDSLVRDLKCGGKEEESARNELRGKLIKLGLFEENIILEALALPKLQKDVDLHLMTIPDGASLLRKLRADLKRATSRRGFKASLARGFGVTQATVTEWINGPAKPSAENTLALLEWVKRAGAKQQNEEPGRALTRPGQMTRKSKINTNEKAKSDQRKS